jgi:hypothetical protein
MRKLIVMSIILGVSILLLQTHGESFTGSGTVNTSSGVPDRDLKYEDFQITPEGYVTGNIVNTSGKTRAKIILDMWTTNMQETRILWRTKLTVGDLGPHATYLVKQPYNGDKEDPARVKFMFRIPSDANFRNK